MVRLFALHPALWVIFAVLLVARHANGETRAVHLRAADEAVSEALQREIYGLAEEREALLRQAIAKAPEHAPALWNLGHLQDSRSRWVSIEEFIQNWSSLRKIKLYESARRAAADSVAGQMELAEYCRREGLLPQMRAALSRVIELEPNHAAARRALGFVAMGPLWISREEMSAEEVRTRRIEESVAKWRPELVEIARDLASDGRSRRAKAAERLAELHDPSIVPALERIVSPTSDEAARQVIDLLRHIADPAASLSLARHAVYYPSPAVRDDAALALAARDKHSYVPALLDLMATTADSRIAFAPLASGRIGYRHAFVRETSDREELLVLDTEYQRVALNGGSRIEARWLAGADIRASLGLLESRAQRQNELTTRLNERIVRTLNRATQQDLPPSPEVWWKWWDRYNQISPTPKEQAISRRVRRVQIVDPVPVVGNDEGDQADSDGSRGGSGGSRRASAGPTPLFGPRLLSMMFFGGGECLVAGTPVWTARGPMAIEDVKRGDLVLSQDVETGELAFKPVLRTTRRPPGATMIISAGLETIQCSSGHTFWVSGEGWKMANELESGMLLHTASGPSQVMSMENASDAEAYNLVVEDFSTYFVGQQKILSHDFTMRNATTAIVPGLMAE